MEWQDEADDEDLRDAVREYLPETVVWTTDWTTGALIEQLRRGIFNVDPPFQRRSAWSDMKSSSYIESLLLGCPVPPITLAELPPKQRGQFQYVVIDGKQRLSSLKRFAVDENLRLSGLETLRSLRGARYADIVDEPEFARFANLPIRTVVMRNWQRDEVLQFVFHRLNTQVTPLSTHELRRSLLGGPFTDFLDERSARSGGIQRILNITEPDYRLRDAELLLRAVAFTCFLSRYRGNLKSFLDSTTRSFNKSWDDDTKEQLEQVTAGIDRAVDTTYRVFGDDAFQRFEEGDFTGRFNRAIFDLMVLTFQFDDVREAAIADPTSPRNSLIRLLSSGEADFSRWTQATTKSKDAVQGRVGAWARTLENDLGVRDLEKRVYQSPLSPTQ